MFKGSYTNKKVIQHESCTKDYKKIIDLLKGQFFSYERYHLKAAQNIIKKATDLLKGQFFSDENCSQKKKIEKKIRNVNFWKVYIIVPGFGGLQACLLPHDVKTKTV